MNNQYTRAVSTQIRSLFSDGFASLIISFFNTNLAFRFAPFVSKDAMGKSFYDLKKTLTTTVGYQSATALHIVACEIVDGKKAADGVLLTIPCASDASLALERKMGQTGQMETLFTIFKNNASISFKFFTHQSQMNENGQMVTKTIESGLGVFAKTLNGYLEGINASGHLNKFGDDLEKFQDEEQQGLNQTGIEYQGNTGQYQQSSYYPNTTN